VPAPNATFLELAFKSYPGLIQTRYEADQQSIYTRWAYQDMMKSLRVNSITVD